MLLPGTSSQVMDASDKEFDAFVRASGLQVQDAELIDWTFDDRVRFINYARNRGIDPFNVPNTNNSEETQKQFNNNSENELTPELFDGDQIASMADLGNISTWPAIQLRNDIDLLISEMEKSSQPEQKEFGD
jgi:hypothetical protein